MSVDYREFYRGRRVLMTGGVGFIGSFYSDSSKIARATGWKPRVTLREGFRRTIEFYRANLARYLEAA
jgi:dTDP-D-glucose 4,6-dehydratase